MTQDVIDKLKNNVMPYGMMIKEYWCNDEVIAFLHKANTNDDMLIYDYDGEFTQAVRNDIFRINYVYRLKHDYVLVTVPVMSNYEFMPIDVKNNVLIVDIKHKDVNISELVNNIKFIGVIYDEIKPIEFDELNNSLSNSLDIETSRSNFKISRIIPKWAVFTK